MAHTLYIATTNPGKLGDFAAAMPVGYTLLPFPGLDVFPVPVEDADTFEGNARIKAIAYSRHLAGELVLADDSGLEVDALNSAPGVYSARYAARENFHPPEGPAPRNNDDRNNACLLDRLRGVPESERSARYQCVLAAATDGQVLAQSAGTVEGRILLHPRGSGGFGYDPLFLLPESALTMAEIDAATKLAFSHRGRALTALLAALGYRVER